MNIILLFFSLVILIINMDSNESVDSIKSMQSMEITSKTYLHTLRTIYKSIMFSNSQRTKMTYILCNPTCDLDSTLSSYLLSVYKNILNKNIIKKESTYYFSTASVSNLFVPVLNCKRGTFFHRLDGFFVLEKFGISDKDFVYYDDDEFSVENFRKKKDSFEVILVDHSILLGDQEYLSAYVGEIYDHHLSKKYEFENLRTMKVMYPLGSCCTLILNEFFLSDIYPLSILPPFLSMTALLIDTHNFSSHIYMNRWVDLDKSIFNNLIKEYKKLHTSKTDDEIKEEIVKYYELITEIKYDIPRNLALGIEVLLNKDLKVFKWGKVTCVWSSLQVSFDEIIERFGIESFVEEVTKLKNEVKHPSIFVSNSKYTKNKKLFLIYLTKEFDHIQVEIFIEKCSEILVGFVENITKDESVIKSGRIFRVILNNNATRKNCEPLFRKVFDDLMK